jgi:excisionase family DNA binding protein
MPLSLDRAAYSIAEVVALTGLGRDKIYGLIRERKLVAKKAGKRTLVTAPDLRSCLEALPAFGSEKRAK